MCTSFVFRKENVLIGMNFDNDGKDFRISTDQGNDFLVSTNINDAFFPSFGISRSGVFINDLMVDANEKGRYKRQNDKRWVTTALIQYIMRSGAGFDEVKDVLKRVEIVNAPNSSTHNLIADRHGNIAIVEPGVKNIFTEPADSGWYAMTNFPLTDCGEGLAANGTGSGSDRYHRVLSALAKLNGPMTVEQGFEVLKSVKQDGPVWRTELSLIYDAMKQELFYCLDQDFEQIISYDFGLQNTIYKRHPVRD